MRTSIGSESSFELTNYALWMTKIFRCLGIAVSWISCWCRNWKFMTLCSCGVVTACVSSRIYSQYIQRKCLALSQWHLLENIKFPAKYQSIGLTFFLVFTHPICASQITKCITLPGPWQLPPLPLYCPSKSAPLAFYTSATLAQV